MYIQSTYNARVFKILQYQNCSALELYSCKEHPECWCNDRKIIVEQKGDLALDRNISGKVNLMDADSLPFCSASPSAAWYRLTRIDESLFSMTVVNMFLYLLKQLGACAVKMATYIRSLLFRHKNCSQPSEDKGYLNSEIASLESIVIFTTRRDMPLRLFRRCRKDYRHWLKCVLFNQRINSWLKDHLQQQMWWLIGRFNGCLCDNDIFSRNRFLKLSELQK